MQIFFIFLLSICWSGYFAIHSLAASNVFKAFIFRKFPNFRPYYRLGYNLISILLLIPPLAVLYLNNWPTVWKWSSSLYWLQATISFACILMFVATYKMYSGLDFLGLSQGLRQTEIKSEFRITPFHRIVRHPWYFLALLFLWSRDMNLGFLLTTILMSGYFIIGSRLEEKKLKVEFGEKYVVYQHKVPALIPLPWKFLTREQAKEISDM